MNLSLDTSFLKKYKSASQQSRAMTEAWVAREMFCLNCGTERLRHVTANKKVFDFICDSCLEEFESKGGAGKLDKKILAGSYKALVKRLQEKNNPHFFFVEYERFFFSVVNFYAIPKNFFFPKMVEKRKALKSTARRAGWVGSYIHMDSISEDAKVFVIKDGIVQSKKEVMVAWKNVLALDNKRMIPQKGWLSDTLRLARIFNDKFSLEDIYTFQGELQKKYPGNKHIKDKLRQQLQILRDEGYIEFIGDGYYRVR